MNIVSKVVCVCSLKDLHVWRTAVKYINKNIPAKDYVVIVPDAEVDLFLNNTPGSVRVEAESHYIGSLKECLKQVAPAENHDRIGWYLQQFIKLAALQQSQDSDVILIWDADTVPLKPLFFGNANGALTYYKSHEYHRPYFHVTEKLLGMQRMVDYSFIAQSFVIKGRWAREFFDYIEARSNKHWRDAIIEQIDWRDGSGFSEYETMGTFLSHTHASEMHAVESKWLRRGNGVIGSVDNLERTFSKILLKKYDFVSFEQWDEPFKSIPKIMRPIVRRVYHFN
jgi:hypothetical protein